MENSETPRPLEGDDKNLQLLLRYTIHLMIELVEVKTVLRVLVGLERDRALDKEAFDAMGLAASKIEHAELQQNLKRLRERLDPTSAEMEMLDRLGEDERVS